MTILELKWRTHWDQHFDRAGPSGGQFMSPRLNDNIQQWLDNQGMPHEFKLEHYACKSKRMQRVRAELHFANESDAVLFKLTWM